MYIREGTILALQQIRAQKLKSFFAVLGVIIGVMFLITVVSVVEGLNKYMEEDFARQVWGLNTLMVRRFPNVNFESDPEVWRAMLRRPRRYDALIAAIDRPVLLVHGTRDRFVPVGAARRTAALNPSWRTAYLEGRGHTPQLEAPDEVLAHLEPWLASLP